MCYVVYKTSHCRRDDGVICVLWYLKGVICALWYIKPVIVTVMAVWYVCCIYKTSHCHRDYGVICVLWYIKPVIVTVMAVWYVWCDIWYQTLSPWCWCIMCVVPTFRRALSVHQKKLYAYSTVVRVYANRPRGQVVWVCTARKAWFPKGAHWRAFPWPSRLARTTYPRGRTCLHGSGLLLCTFRCGMRKPLLRKKHSGNM